MDGRKRVQVGLTTLDLRGEKRPVRGWVGSFLFTLCLSLVGSMLTPRAAEARRFGISDLEFAHDPPPSSTRIVRVRRVTHRRKPVAVALRPAWALPAHASVCLDTTSPAELLALTVPSTTLEELEIEAIVPDLALQAQDRRPSLPPARATRLRAPPERRPAPGLALNVVRQRGVSPLWRRVRSLPKLPDADADGPARA